MIYFKLKYFYVLILIITIEFVFILHKSWSWNNLNKQCNAGIKNLNYIRTDHSDADPISKEGPYLLYIIILSAPANIQHRNVIRSTWGNTIITYSSIRYSFVIGSVGVSDSVMSTIQEEKRKFKDIIVLDDVEEHYRNLSRKVLKAITWIGKHIESIYYLKTDDDCIVIIDNLYDVLTKENLPTSKLVLGLFNINTGVLSSGKWAEYSWFLCSVYLNYPAGAGYILTRDVVRYIALNSDRLMLYDNEDTSLGTWLAAFKINYLTDNRISASPRGCKPSDWLVHYGDIKHLNYIRYRWLKGVRPCAKKYSFL